MGLIVVMKDIEGRDCHPDNLNSLDRFIRDLDDP